MTEVAMILLSYEYDPVNWSHSLTGLNHRAYFVFDRDLLFLNTMMFPFKIYSASLKQLKSVHVWTTK